MRRAPEQRRRRRTPSRLLPPLPNPYLIKQTYLYKFVVNLSLKVLIFMVFPLPLPHLLRVRQLANARTLNILKPLFVSLLEYTQKFLPRPHRPSPCPTGLRPLMETWCGFGLRLLHRL